MNPILYAEDEKNDIFFLRRAFEKTGITQPLVVVPDGQEVIHYLGGLGPFADRDQFPIPCLILLDLNMPKKSGLEVLQWIRSKSSVPTIPVVVMTSSVQDSDLHRAYQEGANAYLVKPSSHTELIEMVKAIKDFWLTHNRVGKRK